MSKRIGTHIKRHRIGPGEYIETRTPVYEEESTPVYTNTAPSVGFSDWLFILIVLWLMGWGAWALFDYIIIEPIYKIYTLHGFWTGTGQLFLYIVTGIWNIICWPFEVIGAILKFCWDHLLISFFVFTALILSFISDSS